MEERTGTLTSPERQFVWGMRYIDDLVIRDRSTANNGSINERRYAMQDGNWNKQASTPTDEGGCSASAVETASPCFICDITGSVGERYAYSAYGALGQRIATDVLRQKPIPAAAGRDVEQEGSAGVC